MGLGGKATVGNCLQLSIRCASVQRWAYLLYPEGAVHTLEVWAGRLSTVACSTEGGGPGGG